MAEFIMVPGAWLGAEAWNDVTPGLLAAGHGVRPITLAGLAERREEPAGSATHVRDIVDAVEQADLRDVVLVGHSYSGIPVGQAAGYLGDRLQRMVLLDANVPVEGGSFVSAWPSGRAGVEAAIARSGGWWPPLQAADFEGQGLDDDQVKRIVSMSTPHPGATLTGTAALVRPLGEIPTTYVKCLFDGPEPDGEVAALLAGDRWRLVEMNTGHWPMFSQPHELVRVLLDAAAG